MNCHLRFSIFVLETLKLKWQYSQYLDLIPTCALAQHIPPRHIEIYIMVMYWYPEY